MSVFNKKKIKDFIIYGFGQAVNLVSPLLVMPLVILVCGQESFGKIGVGFSLALILNGVIDYGSYINGVKTISINRENHKILEENFKAIYFSKFLLLLLVLFLFSILFITIPFFAREKQLFFYSLLIVVGQFINPIWFFQGIENFKWISFVNILSKSIYIILVVFFIKEKNDYKYVNLFLGIGSIIGNFIGLIWLIKKYSFSIGSFQFSSAIKILKEEFSFSASQVFLSLYQFFPIILISYIGGDFMAGQYRVIDQIIMLFKTYLNMFFYFVYANICFELNKNIKKGILAWKQYNGANFILIALLLLFVFINLEFILSYTKIGKNQVAEIISYTIVALFIPLLTAISQPLRQLMFAFNKNKIYIKITILTTILNLLLLILLIKGIGLKGAFASIIITEMIIILLYTKILYKGQKLENEII
jgi:O-antigen/teichoic acid export membrane protein